MVNLQLKTSLEFASPLAPASRLSSETKSWMSWKATFYSRSLSQDCLPPARPRKDFLIILTAFRSRFMEYLGDICLTTARLYINPTSRGGGEEPADLLKPPENAKG